MIDIAKDLIRLSGLEPDLDIAIKYTGTRPGEKTVEELSLPYENLDKTKHEKIFVLKNKAKNKVEFDNIIKRIRSLENNLVGKSAKEVRNIISSILPEYSPDISQIKNSNVSSDKAEA